MVSIFLKPGDRVRVLNDRYDQEDVYTGVSVTAGSVGRILSFDEYSGWIRKLNHVLEGKETPEVVRHLSIVELGIEQGQYLPVQIEEFAPLSSSVVDFWAKQGHTSVFYLAQTTVLLDTGNLEKLS